MSTAIRSTLALWEAEVYAESLRDYGPAAWSQVEPATPYVHGWHIDAIADHLQAVSAGQLRFLIISIAPRSMKSLSTCVFWPTWDWIKHPARRFIFGAYGMDLSERDSLKARRVIESPWYQERFGCQCLATPHAKWCTSFRLTGDQNVKTRYENDRTGGRLTASVKAGTTGEGGDILVLDDPIDILEAQSEAARKRAVDYVKQVWFGRMNDPKRSSMVVIAQRTHVEDVTGVLLKEMQFPWVELRIPTEFNPRKMIVTPIGWKDPRSKEAGGDGQAGALMWPERFGPAENKRAKLDLFTYSAQHDQDPKPAGGALFKLKWFRFWQPKGANLPPYDEAGRSIVIDEEGGRHYVQELPDDFDQLIQSWDMSFKDEAAQLRKGKLPDPVSGGVIGRKGGETYLLDRAWGRMDFPTAMLAVIDMTVRWPKAITKLVEDKANGPAIIAMLRRKVGGFLPVSPEGSKIARVIRKGGTEAERDARAMSMLEIVHAGSFYVPHPAIAPWVWDLIEVLITFPNGATDDDVDMLSQALTHLQQWIWRDADADQSFANAQGPALPSTQAMHKKRIQDVIDAALKPKPATIQNPYSPGRR